MSEHRPVSQRKVVDGWSGKCRCGSPFRAADLSGFLVAWSLHLADTPNEESTQEVEG